MIRGPTQLQFLGPEQRLDFRGECETASEMGVVKGFYAEMIASNEHGRRARAEIADGECEHTVQALYAVRAFLFIKVDDDFGVGIRCEAVAFGQQLTSQFGEVVNLSVVSNPNAAVFIAHRHVAEGREINNGQAAAAQPDIRTVRETLLP